MSKKRNFGKIIEGGERGSEIKIEDFFPIKGIDTEKIRGYNIYVTL